ncbi:Golgi apparatus membrane protein tvp23 [Penicillium atrosanguineum]|uniref:Golgi apparatus membrane protein TVP23 n=1 Tax=Penicillium atrosanguineum TaxID=1132637 RepID=A0A9W9PST1_9EURO|nr:Endoplasmic reticulum vesicle protein 25 [Penicillium atrosanguineum]KAJ5125481.1 Golgi apparatus membrane protein tvp23 [Penicillium atrosanguineum]KAJ5136247.1 Golgi apparatus membrane protein tvp23 [Penicillium atrosanguineum]KAJ5292598.1 Endoplasmic reticulum vesicle protein 25 [Penicillium atrosanguineum]KAJ5303378.1 Golgi apparatus membrane protein tvp23 [Penicillium atrosanguineum]
MSRVVNTSGILKQQLPQVSTASTQLRNGAFGSFRISGSQVFTMDQGQQGELNWRLSAHPITLLVFLGIRIGALLMYLFGVLFIDNFILVFILTLLLLSADFYYLKNIAGRRLVGLRWWNEVNTTSGDSHWVFESADPNVRTISATDKRFFWLSMYVTPALWVGLAVLAIVRLVGVIWLSLVGIALILTITNTVAFSRCDKFSQASTFANSALGGGIVNNIAGGLLGRLFR